MDLEESKKHLPEVDAEFLVEKEYNFDLLTHGNNLLVTIHAFELPDAYDPKIVDLRIVLGPGYPNGNPDMFWTRPWVKLKSKNADPDRSSSPTQYPDGQWQQWSRHFGDGWRPGVDGLRQYLASVKSELRRLL